MTRVILGCGLVFMVWWSILATLVFILTRENTYFVPTFWECYAITLGAWLLLPVILSEGFRDYLP